MDMISREDHDSEVGKLKRKIASLEQELGAFRDAMPGWRYSQTLPGLVQNIPMEMWDQ